MYIFNDYSRNNETQLKNNHEGSCLFLKPKDENGDISKPESLNYLIYVEAFHPTYNEVYEFLIKIAEPVNKPNFIHVYQITLFSMYTAMSLNLDAEMILKSLEAYSKNQVIPRSFKKFIQENTQKSGSAYLYMYKKTYYIKIDQATLEEAIRNSVGKSWNLYQFDDIAVLDADPPTHILEKDQNASIQQQSQPSYVVQQKKKVWDFKVYKVIKKARLFEITKGLIGEGISLINEYCSSVPSQVTVNDSNNNTAASTMTAVAASGNTKQNKLDIELRQITQPRIYQQKALKNIFVGGQPRSATIVLPCGAGKTLLGVIVTEKVKGNTLVICDIDPATQQWKKEFLRWTTVKPNRIKIQTGKTKGLKHADDDPFILITTFKQLSSIVKKTAGDNNAGDLEDFKYDINAAKIIQDMEWDLCIADETQYSAAKTYQDIFQGLNFKLKIGLTATPFREDNKINDLYHVIGPRLYEANISELIQDNYLAKPYCVLFRCNLAENVKELLRIKEVNQASLFAGNPEKIEILTYLIQLHEKRGDKILVFCDQINVLEHYAKFMGYPYVSGDVPALEKLVWLELFKRREINTLFLSRVGDTALDLPIANVCIQIGFQNGSRRQEIQRLGRIMRRKEGQLGEYNAFFYTIISKKTSQVEFYSRRQKSLMDLGINFEVFDESQLKKLYDEFDDETKLKCKEFKKDLSFLRGSRQERQDHD